MTDNELERSKIIHIAIEKRITQKEGARRLGISERQFRRLIARHRQGGDEAIISRQRGKPSNHRMAEEKRQAIVKFIHETRFEGFGPTLLLEKLEEYQGIHISKESMRQIMIEEGCHKSKRKKKQRIHPLREARPRRGELVQIDGSYHAWLEDRGAKACLLLFIDDATHEALTAQFVDHETFFSYAELCKKYFKTIGMPVTFYSDKFSVFRVNAANAVKTDAITQFSRALGELNIELICANSPQAKGRVERAYQTFQDRLVKELRLQQISDYQRANDFLPEFLAIYNRKFAVLPRSLEDAHVPLDPSVNLDHIFSIHHYRVISKDLQIQFDNHIYQIVTNRPTYALQGRDVLAILNQYNEVSFFLNGTLLKVKEIRKQPKQARVVSSKSINHVSHTPSQDHTWHNYGK